MSVREIFILAGLDGRKVPPHDGGAGAWLSGIAVDQRIEILASALSRVPTHTQTPDSARTRQMHARLPR